MNAGSIVPVGCVLAGGVAAFFVACSSPQNSVSGDGGPANGVIDAGPGISAIAGLSSDDLAAFLRGEQAFFSELQPADGLGPLYTKASCGSCHGGSARGPGAALKMVAVGADGVTPIGDQTSWLPFGNTEHPQLVTAIPGVHTPILPPFEGLVPDAGDAGVSIRLTTRLGPPLFGRGYLEAIDDSEIERMETAEATRSDGIHGRINRLPFISQPNPVSTFDNHQTGDIVIGRFGLKARISTLDEFAADALQSDMGLTTPMRVSEFANPDGVTDDLKPGIDVTADDMNARAMFVRLLDIPPRAIDSQGAIGKAWFTNCKCNVCHVESLHTRADYPIPQLANIDADVYTDLLLHDMGDGLSDSVSAGNEGQAGPRDWRTLPLIGMRFSTSFLHDGRASTIDEAIRAHDSNGSEASAATQCFTGLAENLQQQLIVFIGEL